MVVPSDKKELVSLVMEDICAKARHPDQMADGQGRFPAAESDMNAILEYYPGSSELRIEPAELRIETPEFIRGTPERISGSPEHSHENLENAVGVHEQEIETPESRTEIPELPDNMCRVTSRNADYTSRTESPDVLTEILEPETKPPESVTGALKPDCRKLSPEPTRHSEAVAGTPRVRTRTSGSRLKTTDCVLFKSSEDLSRTSEVPALHTVLRTGVPLAEPEDEDQLLGEEVEEERVAGGQRTEEHEHTRADKSGPGDGMENKTKSRLEDSHCDIKDSYSEDVMEDGEEEEEELILGSNFADSVAAPPVETSFLPPLTMTTPLKCLAPPLPLLTSTPAVLGRPPFLLPYPLLSLPPSSSPPPSSLCPDGPLSLPGLVSPGGSKSYDYLLKVLLVGDSDCGKQEILAGMEDGAVDSPYASTTGAAYKTTIILIDGKRVKLQLWDTSGQGRFCTIIRSYSRGAQGILLVYDITNKWSFEGMDRWVKEVEEHAPGIPKVLVGNRLHLAFNRQVEQVEAERYAERHHMGFYEVSPLVNFNITESFQELCRMALRRNGMERLWRGRQVTSLHELCCHAIVGSTNVYGIDKLPLPDRIKANLKSYALSNATNTTVRAGTNYKSLKEAKKKRSARPADSVAAKCASVSRKSCVIS